LIDILKQFAKLATAYGDPERAARCVEQAEQLRAAIEKEAWDGRWYRRAYFDDGTPLGSAQNDECQIDSIVQTWAVLAGVADPDRARQAMQALEERLVKERERLILLFDPPFDKGPLHPGYIKGYVPGIRENGGQYTHAAAWVVQAVALQGRGKRALELFDLLNPIHHARTEEDAARYRVEPYVVVADIYSQPPHVGRGGWTWYTGSAGWLYRVALENLLGFQLRGNRLTIRPCISGNWPKFEITYRYRATTYHITILNPRGLEQGIPRLTLDGQQMSGDAIELVDDRKRHELAVELG
jgi:cyclic beta-1,2-glucan synthetase